MDPFELRVAGLCQCSWVRHRPIGAPVFSSTMACAGTSIVRPENIQLLRRRLGGRRCCAGAEQLMFSGRTIDVPAQAIVGREDWGANRTVGGPMNIGKTGYTQFKGVPYGGRSWPLGP